MSNDFVNDVKVSPTDTLLLKPGDATEVSVENTGEKNLTYKLKTTRPASVKPTKAFGLVEASGNDEFKVNYKPTSDEKPFGDSDRITLLVNIMPESFMKPEHYWKTPNAVTDARRIVLKLEKASEAKAPEKGKAKEKKKKESEKEEVASEESEVETETESGVESGSETSESGA